MLKRLQKLPRMLVLAAAAGAAATGMAAESVPPAPSAYRLSIEKPDAFRFTAREPYLAAPRKGAAIPAQLAGQPFAAQIDRAARQASLDPALVHAVIHVESRYNPAARSPKGAVGLMQLLPETAARYGVADPARAPDANLRAGTRYLSDLMALFEGRLELALAAYNAGENAVLRHGLRIPPYRETREYVPAVLARYRDLQGPPPAPSVPTRIEYLPGTRLNPDSLGAAQER